MTAAQRLAARILEVAAIAIVVAVTTHKSYELDRFFIPKELVLHLAALLAGLLTLRHLRLGGRADLLLGLWLLLGALSAALAVNRWLAIQALAISISSAVLFWVARSLAHAGLSRGLVIALGLAVIAVAVTSLLQAYGVRTELFSLNRSPGGTLGNRNFVAHAAAFGLPLLIVAAVGARRFHGWLAGGIGVAVVTAALVLTRSRAGWLALALALAVLIGSILAAPALRRRGAMWLRLGGILLLAGGGVAAALLIPNTLRWTSDDPYLDTVRRVADYGEGSGRGRLIQYQRSLRMALAHPLLGVGPGNWPVEYPGFAAPRDPSLDPSEPGRTHNPWPSSDLVAWIAERGVAATLALLLFFLGIAHGAWKRLRHAPGSDEALGGAGLLATVVATGVAGAFDAVLLLALPSLLVWTGLGALSVPTFGPAPEDARGRLWGGLALAACAFAVLVTAGQIAAMEIDARRNDRASLSTAIRLDPGNYRIRLALARNGPRERRCEHARALVSLYPHAGAAKSAAARCQ